MPWNEPFTREEVYRPSQPTTVFSLKNKYHPGLGEVEVWYNGIRAVLGQDYVETDMYTITFLYPVQPGDIVIFRFLKMW
jgi:hypothetical protein